MPKRLAITIAGAVSLGSYEAGVLYEILEAIAVNNAAPNTADENKIYVDVITGASAGGMCAAILAQKLLYDGDSLRDPAKNVLYTAWVRDVSLDKLFDFRDGDDPTHSILSSQLIEEISQTYLLSRYQNGKPPTSNPHGAVNPNNLSIRLGLALSNLDGIDYSQEMRTSGNFTYTRYQDEFKRECSVANDNSAAWDEIRNAAVSCGSFPFAFAVKALQRQKAEYTDPTPSGFPPLNYKFAYTDAGCFQNEPLGLAKTLVDQIDEHLNCDSRYYLFIAPGARDSTIVKDDKEKGTVLIRGENANFYVTANALVGAIFYQARFHDWILAEKVNHDIDVFNRRATQLKKAIALQTVDVKLIKDAADAYLAQLKLAEPNRINQVLIDASLKRLQDQFPDESKTLRDLPNGKDALEAWLKSILVLELAADLDKSDEMNIFAVTANEKELAGSPLHAFAGFFDEKYRQHDYDLGRNKAKAFIRAQTSNPPAIHLGPFAGNPGADIPITVYDGLKASDLNEDERRQLADRLCKRADSLLEEAGIGLIKRKAVMTFVVNGKISDWLEL